PQPIATEEQAPAASIPQREGEHAVERIDEVGAAIFVEVDQTLGVGVGGKDVAARHQLSAQLAIIVNLAVEDELDGSVLVGDGLAAAVEVDDRQAAHADGAAGVAPGAV